VCAMRDASAPKRVGILISGRGSNMVAIVEAMRDGRIPAEPAVVISNVPGAAGLARAEALGASTAVIDHKVVRPREAHERKLVETLREHRVGLSASRAICASSPRT
jgi:phosphoribosylglycinamide formyltransferase-1